MMGLVQIGDTVSFKDECGNLLYGVVSTVSDDGCYAEVADLDGCEDIITLPVSSLTVLH